MTRTFTFTHHIERSFTDALGWEGEAEIELQVTYSVTPYVPAQGPTYASGGQPAEGGEVELISVTLDGREETLTDAEESAILQACEERAADDLADYASDRADYEYDRRRDERMEREWEARP